MGAGKAGLLPLRQVVAPHELVAQGLVGTLGRGKRTLRPGCSPH